VPTSPSARKQPPVLFSVQKDEMDEKRIWIFRVWLVRTKQTMSCLCFFMLFLSLCLNASDSEQRKTTFCFCFWSFFLFPCFLIVVIFVNTLTVRVHVLLCHSINSKCQNFRLKLVKMYMLKS
jgi:hypothetical protein